MQTMLPKRCPQTVGSRDIEVHAHEFFAMRKDLGRRAFERDVPALEDHNAVRLGSLFHEMGDHDDAHTAFVELAANMHERSTPTGIEHRRGLIENQNARLHGKRTSKRDTLLLSTRKRMSLTALEPRKTNRFERSAHMFDDLLGRHAQILGAKRHIVLDKRSHQLIIGILKDHAHIRADIVHIGRIRRVQPAHANDALVGGQQRVEVFGERGLPRTVGSQNADELTVSYIEGDAT